MEKLEKMKECKHTHLEEAFVQMVEANCRHRALNQRLVNIWLKLIGDVEKTSLPDQDKNEPDGLMDWVDAELEESRSANAEMDFIVSELERLI